MTGAEVAAAVSEVAETSLSDINTTELSPVAETMMNDCNSYWDNNFSGEQYEVKNEKFTDYQDRLDKTPKENSSNGDWVGNRGESKFIPNGLTEKTRAALDKLKEKGQDGVEYRDAEPDFGPVAEETVEIDNMTEHRDDYYDSDGTKMDGNFSQADQACAKKWNESAKDGKTDWTARDVSDWRKDNNCSWHERQDCKTMDLVDRDVHETCTHSGGVAECKAKNNSGGGFDV